MTVARRIKPEEADQFLELLCLVFALDLERARGVFFTEPLFDINRKWALFVDGQMESILTTARLEFGWGRAFGIAGVATRPTCQGRGYAQALLEKVLCTAELEGEGPALLFAQSEALYRRLGFEPIDEVVRGEIKGRADFPDTETLQIPEVRKAYDEWSSRDAARLRRDEERWRYWCWTYRSCEPVPGGYLCAEPGLVREAVASAGLEEWPVPDRTEWFGLQKVTEQLGVPLHRSWPELILMGRGFPGRPEIFMTDQF
ncbi:MAG: GNAT family N-acetyltransferase [Fimbriimonadaceae bacterium]|nr:GNAT family N-acetyltransferase [Fimbriimonadaceae bacterium]QYK56302.1 MAG: GNAT family N-acetyltransferase [Fimbriimonadaceae bacterium]